VDGLEGDGGVVVSWVGGLLKGWLFRSLRDFSYGSLFSSGVGARGLRRSSE